MNDEKTRKTMEVKHELSLTNSFSLSLDFIKLQDISAAYVFSS